MSSLNGQISFNAEFDLGGFPSIKLTASSSIPSGDQPNLIGYFSITQPDGLTVIGNFTNPSVVWNGSSYTPFVAPLRTNSDGKVQQGNYVITLYARCSGYTDGQFGRPFTFQFTVPCVKLQNNLDVFTPDLNITDVTVYQVSNYTILSSVNSLSAQIGTLGLVTAANTPIFDLKYNGNYYDATIVGSYSNTVTYQNTSASWLTVVYQFGATINTAADTPPQMSAMVADLTAMKTALDSGKICGCGCTDENKCNYMYAETILAHIQMRMCAGDLAVQNYIMQFLALTHNGKVPTYINTNTVIPPYVINFCNSSTGSNTGHISITQADFKSSDGVTYLNPLLISDNVSIFFSDVGTYIYQSKGEWQYVTGGIKILIPGFDARVNTYNLELDIKKIG